MTRGNDADEPTLGEAWAMLGERLGLEVDVRGERSIRAHGTIRGRAIVVDHRERLARGLDELPGGPGTGARR